VRLELSGAALVGVGARTPYTGGGSLRAAFEAGPIGVVLGVTGGAPWVWQMGLARVGVVRIPIDLDVRAIVHVGRASVALEGGPILAWVDVSGRGLPGATGDARLQTGARASLLARADIGSFSPYAAVWGEWSAPAYDVAIVPDGRVGAIPSLWVGVSLGLSVRLAALSR
jgi:hypothetical protein